jgi:hypothetical protein
MAAAARPDPRRVPWRWKVGGLVVVAVFTGMVVGVSLAAGLPVTQKLAVPVVCPSGTTGSVVVLERISVRPGETITTSELYCEVGPGTYQRAGELAVTATLVGYATAATAALVLLLSARVRRRSRRAAAAEGGAARADA